MNIVAWQCCIIATRDCLSWLSCKFISESQPIHLFSKILRFFITAQGPMVTIFGNLEWITQAERSMWSKSVTSSFKIVSYWLRACCMVIVTDLTYKLPLVPWSFFLPSLHHDTSNPLSKSTSFLPHILTEPVLTAVLSSHKGSPSLVLANACSYHSPSFVRLLNARNN